MAFSLYPFSHYRRSGRLSNQALHPFENLQFLCSSGVYSCTFSPLLLIKAASLVMKQVLHLTPERYYDLIIRSDGYVIKLLLFISYFVSPSAEHVELCTCMKLQGSRGSPSRYGWIRQAVELLRRSKRAKRVSQHQGLISTFADSASDVRLSRKQGLHTEYNCK